MILYNITALDDLLMQQCESKMELVLYRFNYSTQLDNGWCLPSYRDWIYGQWTII